MIKRLPLYTAFGFLFLASVACHHHDHYYEQSPPPPPPQEQPVYQQTYEDDYDGVHVRAGPWADVNVRWKKNSDDYNGDDDVDVDVDVPAHDD